MNAGDACRAGPGPVPWPCHVGAGTELGNAEVDLRRRARADRTPSPRQPGVQAPGALGQPATTAGPVRAAAMSGPWPARSAGINPLSGRRTAPSNPPACASAATPPVATRQSSGPAGTGHSAMPENKFIRIRSFPFRLRGRAMTPSTRTRVASRSLTTAPVELKAPPTGSTPPWAGTILRSGRAVGEVEETRCRAKYCFSGPVLASIPPFVAQR